ncbi:MAG: fasciclin domain-containing protein [Coleofasciculaceae cyanobacterium]
MKPTNNIARILLVGLLSLGSAVALSACSAEEEAKTTSEVPSATEQTADATSGESATETETASSEDAASDNILVVASNNGSFETLTKAIEAAGLTETLAGEGPFTVFAPTDEAFAALPEGTVEELLKPENKDKLVKILTYHVVPVEVTSAQITPGEVTTVEGSAVDVQVEGDTVKVEEATVTQPDVKASNGVIHVIDTVMMPPEA